MIRLKRGYSESFTHGYFDECDDCRFLDVSMKILGHPNPCTECKWIVNHHYVPIVIEGKCQARENTTVEGCGAHECTENSAGGALTRG